MHAHRAMPGTKSIKTDNLWVGCGADNVFLVVFAAFLFCSSLKILFFAVGKSSVWGRQINRFFPSSSFSVCFFLHTLDHRTLPKGKLCAHHTTSSGEYTIVMWVKIAFDCRAKGALNKVNAEKLESIGYGETLFSLEANFWDLTALQGKFLVFKVLQPIWQNFFFYFLEFLWTAKKFGSLGSFSWPFRWNRC